MSQHQLKFNDSWTGWKRVRKVKTSPPERACTVRKIFFDNLKQIIKFVPYDLPKMVNKYTGDEALTFGKYNGLTFKEVRKNHKGYCQWAIKQETNHKTRFSNMYEFQDYLKKVKVEVYENETGLIYDIDDEYRINPKYYTTIQVYLALCGRIRDRVALMADEEDYRHSIEFNALRDLHSKCNAIKNFIQGMPRYLEECDIPIMKEYTALLKNSRKYRNNKGNYWNKYLEPYRG